MIAVKNLQLLCIQKILPLRILKLFIIMKNTIWILIFIFTADFYLMADSEKEIKAGINHVTVYPDRAQINRETAVDIPAGTTLLKITGLSPYIDVRSIQVKGSGNFMILSVNHRNNYLENLEDLPEVKNIRNQIESLKIKVEDEKAAISVLKEKEAFLVANRAILVKETTFSVEQLRSVMDLYTSNMEQVTISVLKRNRVIKEYEEQISALQKQISDKFGRQQLPSGEISVTVSCEKALSGKISLSYVVSNAGWYPSYDIRVDDITRPVNIFYKANVHQNTGIPWKDVNISFSNATPWISGDIPVLDPWFIDYFYPVQSIRIRGTSSGVERANAPVLAEMDISEKSIEAKEMEAAPPPVQKRIGETTVFFDLSTPFSLLSDGKIQTVEIQRTSTAAEYKYVTVPKLSPIAYLTGNITGWAEQDLIGGEATLYFENTFVGNTYLNVNQLKDTLTVSLGPDNSILVKREKRQDFTSKRVLGSNKTETYSYLITIRNNKPIPVQITLRDQIPISSNSGIEVNAVELSGGKLNTSTGEVNWELELKPSETLEITMTYSVKYPKDKTIILE
jgi:uncharacterized protein (TIGR02231 family)